ncbi:MAG: DUF3488 domain-containing protein, partial [Desulfobacterales bacterium]|nr:DUF3488 domain-containing protein [Desulfobacterales bacterium]
MKNESGATPAILLALTFSALPHARVLPPWIMGWCGACWGYALLAARLGWPWPGKWIRAALSVGGFLGALY